MAPLVTGMRLPLVRGTETAQYQSGGTLGRGGLSPFIAVPLYCGLAFFEVAVGILFLAGLRKRWTLLAAIIHLLGTFRTLILVPSAVFLGRFPFLTMEGEFVVKNLVLLAALYAIWKLEIEGSAEPGHTRAYFWAVWSIIAATSLLLVGSGAWLTG
ncbi:hypothetical protein PC39_10237 [Salinisphaera sp. PC39]|uniref:DoxX-like family protein n=1 Tax=Salinisphaera sp. PC39 TaxID=1304156 RepID=UPI003341208F